MVKAISLERRNQMIGMVAAVVSTGTYFVVTGSELVRITSLGVSWFELVDDILVPLHKEGIFAGRGV